MTDPLSVRADEISASPSHAAGGRRLLFLAFEFPPVHSIACVRSWNIAKYLSRLGWQVTVMTPDPSFYYYPVSDEAVTMEARLRHVGVRRVVTGQALRPLLRSRGAGRIGSFASRAGRKVARHLADSVGWPKVVELACRNLRSDEIDLVLATGPPYESFEAARRVAKRFQAPYVLDYRDPWTGNPHKAAPATTVDEERRLLNGAAAVTIVSPSWRSALARRFDVGDKLHVLSNGYDPEDLSRVERHEFGHFAIVYGGQFYPPKRVITPVMAALARLKQLGRDGLPGWRFHYYGPHDALVRRDAQQYDVLDRVVLHGSVSRAESLSAMRGAEVAVVITSTQDRGEQNDRGIVTGKVFEPLGLQTPILLIAPRDSDARNVVDGDRSQCFVGSDTEGMARFLLERMQSRTSRQDLPVDGPYSWPELSRQLSDILIGSLRGKVSKLETTQLSQTTLDPV